MLRADILEVRPMSRECVGWARGVVLSLILIQTIGAVGLARADDRLRRSRRAVLLSRARPVCVPSPSPPSTLGTFVPTPAITVGGDYPASMAGYTPLGMYGDQTMALYGPFSALRPTVAPVITYTRGYNGEV